jgi:plastocyanin
LNTGFTGRGRFLPAALAGAALLAGCKASVRPAPRRIAVEISGMAFHPAQVDAAAGDTIVWVNHDMVPHTATAAGSFDTGSIAAGDSARTVAAHNDTFACTFHPTMTGALNVR